VPRLHTVMHNFATAWLFVTKSILSTCD